MLDELLAVFADTAPGLFVDATLGGAGHALALLGHHSSMRLLGIDRDEDALRAASKALGSMGGRATLRHARFDRIAEMVSETGATSIVGALFDLGVSSPQFDVAERGFSYRHDAPLDMRMDRSQTVSAFNIVNEWGFEDLVRMLQDNADERFAARVARAIIAARPIERTVQLADVVTMAIPAAARRRGGHPAKRTFQAIRIAVNSELEILESSLEATIELLAPGARLAVLTYHSGEDRIVKRAFRRAVTGGCDCPPGLPCGCGARPSAKTIRAPREATKAEQESNPRSRSAKLRVIERLAGEMV
jgi:16S rRNA (cytosine1402-N4)-methyltransferase